MNAKKLLPLESYGPWAIALDIGGVMTAADHRFPGRAQAEASAYAARAVGEETQAIAIRVGDLPISGTPTRDVQLAVAHLVVMARHGAHPHGRMIDMTAVQPVHVESVRRIYRGFQGLRDRIIAEGRRYG